MSEAASIEVAGYQQRIEEIKQSLKSINFDP